VTSARALTQLLADKFDAAVKGAHTVGDRSNAGRTDLEAAGERSDYGGGAPRGKTETVLALGRLKVFHHPEVGVAFPGVNGEMATVRRTIAERLSGLHKFALSLNEVGQVRDSYNVPGLLVHIDELQLTILPFGG